MEQCDELALAPMHATQRREIGGELRAAPGRKEPMTDLHDELNGLRVVAGIRAVRFSISGAEVANSSGVALALVVLFRNVVDNE